MIKWADWQDVLAAVIQPNSGITRCVFFGNWRRCCGCRNAPNAPSPQLHLVCQPRSATSEHEPKRIGHGTARSLIHNPTLTWSNLWSALPRLTLTRSRPLCSGESAIHG